MSPHLGYLVCALHCFPRVSGDEPIEIKDASEADVFSPRERG